MSNLDISRSISRPPRYVAARFQQGRPILDADFNASADGQAQALRDAVLAIIGNKASPDDGFLPDLSVGDTVTSSLVRFGSLFEAFVLNFMLKPGTLYVGGLRFTLDAPEPVVFQRGYLQMGPGTAPRAALGQSRQLLVLRGWEQSITAVEDRQLGETALGGADTTARTIRRHRVETYDVEAGTCPDAMEEVIDGLTADGGSTYDPATCALRSKARLRISFVDDAPGDCPACRPRLAGRYLGAEPHNLRLMLATPSRFVWALDTPTLHRVKLVMEGSGVAKIEMLTPPKDETLQPRHGSVIELLPWASLLKNGEPQAGKIAGQKVTNEKTATPVGFFAEAISTYDVSGRTVRVRLSTETLAKIGIADPKGKTDPEAAAQQAVKTGEPPVEDVIALEWDEAHPNASELNAGTDTDAFTAFLYMRIWEHAAAGQTSVPITATAPLGRTGIVPHFSGPGIAGDTWSCSVSPLSNDRVLPLGLMEDGGAPPDGPQRVLAPLALLDWTSQGGVVHTLLSLKDCRPALPSVADRGCCTVWVGRGEDGDTDTIQAAIDRLPASGGRVCVLPGIYREEVRIAQRVNVTLVGCGPRSELRSPDETSQAALLTCEPVDGIARLSIRDFAITARGQTGIAASGRRISLEGVTVRTRRGGDGQRGAIQIIDGADVSIRRCTVSAGRSLTHDAAIYLHAPGGAVVADNHVEAIADDGSARAWGGIHLAGGTRDAEIVRNRVDGGRGHGITLGSVRFRARNGIERDHEGAGIGQSEAEAPFAVTGRIVPFVFDPDEDDPVAAIHYPDAQPMLDDIVIRDNEITGMGGAAIASLAIRLDHDDEAVGPPLCIRERMLRVANLTIAGNVCRGNLSNPPAEPELPQVLGAVALSAVINLSVSRNTIEGNGIGTGHPTCGVYLAEGSRLQILANHIRSNGDARRGERTSEMLGGGIVLSRPRLLDFAEVGPAGPRIETAVIADNVVEQADGPALVAVVAGPLSITGNHLQSSGIRGSVIMPASATVTVLAFGPPAEAIDIPPNEPDPQRWRQPVGSQQYLTTRAQALSGPSGAVLFCSNVVIAAGQRTESVRMPSRISTFLGTTASLTASGNEFASRADRLIAGAVLAGATVSATGNHASEGVNATQTSLAAAAPMLANGADNISTHCTVVYAGLNDGDPDYKRDEDNLVLLSPRPNGCRGAANDLEPVLADIIARIFDVSRPAPVPIPTRGVM